MIKCEFEPRKAQQARWGLVNRWIRDNSRTSQCINSVDFDIRWEIVSRDLPSLVSALEKALATRPEAVPWIEEGES